MKGKGLLGLQRGERPPRKVPDPSEPSPEKDSEGPTPHARPLWAAVQQVPASAGHKLLCANLQAVTTIPIPQTRKRMSGGVKSLAPDWEARVEAQLEVHLVPKLMDSEH